MKRAITALSVLCGGLLFVSPVTNAIFAQNINNKPATESVENVDTNINKKSVTKLDTNIDKETIVKSEEDTVNTNIKDEIKVNEPNKEEIVKPSVNNEVVKEENNQTTQNVTEEDKNTDATNEQIIKPETEDKNTVEVIDVLNQEQAKELLQMRNQGVNFTYKGDENTFSALSQKGLSGYVFFPDYDTDLGFFVDKNTANVYYFHPSGYIELAL